MISHKTQLSRFRWRIQRKIYINRCTSSNVVVAISLPRTSFKLDKSEICSIYGISCKPSLPNFTSRVTAILKMIHLGSPRVSPSWRISWYQSDSCNTAISHLIICWTNALSNTNVAKNAKTVSSWFNCSSAYNKRNASRIVEALCECKSLIQVVIIRTSKHQFCYRASFEVRAKLLAFIKKI